MGEAIGREKLALGVGKDRSIGLLIDHLCEELRNRPRIEV